MTGDAGVFGGPPSYRDLRRSRRKRAKLREQTRKLHETTEAQIKKQRDFWRVDGPSSLLQRPAELLPGQEWGLWVFDDALYEHVAVIGVRNGIVVAQTEDGQLLAVEEGQLLRRGHFLGWVR